MIPGSGRSPGEGHGSPLQCSCLEDPMDRGGWWTTVHGVTDSPIRLSGRHCPLTHGFIYLCMCLFVRVFISACVYLCMCLFRPLRVFTAALGSLLFPRVGPALHCAARPSHCSGFSCCRAQAPGARASVAAARRLSCLDLLASVVASYGHSCSETCGIFPDPGSNQSPLH